MRTSRRMLRQIRQALSSSFFFSCFINLLMLATPLYILQVFESVVPLGSIETLIVLTCMAAAAVFAQALLEGVREFILIRAGVWLDRELGQYVVDNGLKVGSSPAEFSENVRALEQVKSFITGPAITPLFDAPWVPVFLIILAALHPILGIAAAVTAAILLLCAIIKRMVTNRIRIETSESQEFARRWWEAVCDTGQLAGALGLAPGASSRWQEVNRRKNIGSASQARRSSVVKVIARTVRVTAQVALYGFGAWLLVFGELTPGALVASAILLGRALAPLEQFVGTLDAAQASWKAYKRLRDLPPDAQFPTVRKSHDISRGQITLSGVTYFYPSRNAAALRGIDLKIAPGEYLGVLGPNSAGKSTLLGVMAGALTPTSGSAELDGVPVWKWQRLENPPPIGYHPDEPVLIEGTVHENIACFREASLMSVAQSAIHAGVHDILHGLPLGYETNVGPRGQGLSFHERRAVALARALHGAPPILILDEPEIGLDASGLRALVSALARLKTNGTTIVVATQDPRLLSSADRVALVDSGTLQRIKNRAEISESTQTQAQTPPPIPGAPLDGSVVQSSA